MLDNSFFTGHVVHARTQPKPHRFTYSLYYSLLNLAEVDDIFSRSRFWSVEKPNLVSFKRRDYFGEHHLGLEQAIRQRVLDETGNQATGNIFMLTHLRQWGACFNPVTFYFVLNDQNTAIAYLLFEINNTPWNERHSHFHACDQNHSEKTNKSETAFSFEKAFHVSPFLPMDMRYQCNFQIQQETIRIRMNLFKDDHCMLRTALSLEAQPMSARNMALLPVRHPLMTLRVLRRIYYQALCLKLKGIPFFTHPKQIQEMEQSQ